MKTYECTESKLLTGFTDLYMGFFDSRRYGIKDRRHLVQSNISKF